MKTIMFIAATCAVTSAQAQYGNLWGNPEQDRQRQQLWQQEQQRQAAEQRRHDERMRSDYERAVQERRLHEERLQQTREQNCTLQGGRWTYGSCIPATGSVR